MKYEEIFKTRFDSLNEEQKQAVNLIEGPLLVIAGPGSGKTELLSMRVANILKQTDALPSSILCLTFTDSAAFNMRKRLIEIIGEEAYKVSIHTFHSFGKEIIAYNSDYFSEGLLKNSIDEIQSIKILEDIFKTLDHKNPLDGRDGKNKFYTLIPTEKTINTLKKEGITPEEFKKILEENAKFLSLANTYLKGIFPKRMCKEFITEFKKLYESLKEIKITSTTNFKSLSEKIIEGIKAAIEEFEEVKNSKPLTAWKNENIIYDDDKNNIFKETKNQEKLLAIADVYKQYQTYLKTNDLFDFQDMIMEAISAIEKYPNLKATLQERNQYVLIDEFQDTSAAQLKLIESILDFELADGNPNVMAVGDDDQSIFKFQGANLDNIMNFRSKFPKTKIVILNKNYRSNQKIISFIRHNIKKGKERLETKYPDITKELICANKNVPDGEITLKKFADEKSELFSLCEKIKELIDKNKIPAEEIAIIAPKHETLGHAAKYLDQNNINVYYEREENILELPHIKPILSILKFTENLLNENFYYSNHLLPEILSYEFLKINAVDLYKISLKSYTEKSEWLSIMLEHENENIKNLGKFLIALGKLAKTLTAEELIDIITGIKELSDGDFTYTSNYKNFYFNDEKFKNEKSIYIKNLNNLKSLIVSIRKLSTNKAISIKEILAHFDFILDNNLRLVSSQKINSTSSAI
ncbi:MAG: ATP-dependent helicase, partial [Candidatus Gracilibacteria bacterium]